MYVTYEDEGQGSCRSWPLLICIALGKHTLCTNAYIISITLTQPQNHFAYYDANLSKMRVYVKMDIIYRFKVRTKREKIITKERTLLI